MTDALIALGSNLGDRHEHLAHALAGIVQLPKTHLVATSTLYETAPVGGPDNQGPFLNAAVRVETGLRAANLLSALHEIEASRQRERRVRWDARTLDLDLLVFGNLVSEDAALLLPHPRMHVRRFVMVPVCDIAADMVHPALGMTMDTIRAGLEAEPGDLTAVDPTWGDETLVAAR